MAEHTPGPWTVTEEIDRFHGGELIRPGNGKTASPVAVVCDFNRYDRDDERRANGRLMAAAPDLLEACRSALRLIDGHKYPMSLSLIVDAIAKAEGN